MKKIVLKDNKLSNLWANISYELIYHGNIRPYLTFLALSDWKVNTTIKNYKPFF